MVIPSRSSFGGRARRRRPFRWLGRLLLILIGLDLIYFGLYFVARGPRTASPQFIAHRGGTVETPENTLAAFENAIALGVDWLEFDVQRTRDGVLVVIHDETVDRTTNGTGAVRDLDLAEIRALDAGRGEPVPTFEEVIALAQAAGVGILPEAKSPDLYPGLEEAMVAALEAAGYADRAVVQSFVPASIERVRQASPDQAVCPLYGLWRFDLGDPPAGAGRVCPMAEMALLYPWMIRQAHREGRQVYIWFGALESPLLMRLMLIFGADGLMVDDPAALARILERAPR